jgi:hypothetical protein
LKVNHFCLAVCTYDITDVLPDRRWVISYMACQTFQLTY